MDGEILRRVIANDAGVAGLRIQEESPHLVPEGEWRRVGDAIANSRRLLKLQVESFADRGLLLGLARNRSIQHLSLLDVYLQSEHFEHIGIVNPFGLLNCNLRCIDLAWCDLTHILSCLFCLCRGAVNWSELSFAATTTDTDTVILPGR